MQLTGIPLAELWPIGAAALVAIAAAYLLRLKRRRVEVPFGALWARAIAQERSATSWWRKLRRLLSFLFWIGLAALLLFALADPRPSEEVVAGRRVVILIDSSASMGATDVSGAADRLDAAKRAARQFLDTVGPEDRVMLVNFHDRVEPLSPFVSESALLERPLDEIRVSPTSTRYADALRFAADALRPYDAGELMLLSDGAGLDPDALTSADLAPGTAVRHVSFGEERGNLAVTEFAVRRYPANTLDYELFVRVENTFERPIRAILEISADDRLVDQKEFTMAALGSFSQFYPSQAVSGERLVARVRVASEDARDPLHIDDLAYAVLPAAKKRRVLLSTEGNLYLEGALLLNPNVELEVTTPAALASSPPAPGAFDAIILDRAIPDALPERGNFLYVDPQGERSPWEMKGRLERPIVTSTKKAHPLLRWIALKDVNFAAASKLGLEAGDEVVASSFGDPMIVTRKEARRSLVALAFDVRASDLPLRVGLPLLLINTLDYFALQEDRFRANVGTGQTFEVEVPDGIDEVTIVGPDGASRVVPASGGSAVGFADEAGFYEVAIGADSTTLVAANMRAPGEARIAPGEAELGDEIKRASGALFFERSEYWIPAVLLALLLLFVEWWAYHRRVMV